MGLCLPHIAVNVLVDCKESRRCYGYGQRCIIGCRRAVHWRHPTDACQHQRQASRFSAFDRMVGRTRSKWLVRILIEIVNWLWRVCRYSMWSIHYTMYRVAFNIFPAVKTFENIPISWSSILRISVAWLWWAAIWMHHRRELRAFILSTTMPIYLLWWVSHTNQMFVCGESELRIAIGMTSLLVRCGITIESMFCVPWIFATNSFVYVVCCVSHNGILGWPVNIEPAAWVFQYSDLELCEKYAYFYK